MITDARVSFERIRALFLAEETSVTITANLDEKYAIQMESAYFKWNSPDLDTRTMSEFDLESKLKRPSFEENSIMENCALKSAVPLAPFISKEIEPSLSNIEIFCDADYQTTTLNNVNIAIPKGQLVAIVGSIGQGKTSLLNAILGEMQCTNGNVSMTGSIAYCSQTAWLQSNSIRENILFGKPMDISKYVHVIDACCLSMDLNQFEGSLPFLVLFLRSSYRW